MAGDVKADAFFKPGYKAATKDTADFIDTFAVKILGKKASTPKNGPKFKACLVDYVRLVQSTPSGLVAWPMEDSLYVGQLYGRSIAEKVKRALVPKYLKVKAEHKVGQCQVYQPHGLDLPVGLEFIRERSPRVLKVRGPSYWSNGQKKKGKLIPLSKLPKKKVKARTDEMKLVNDMMVRHPLHDPSGKSWDSCYRSFNDGERGVWKNLGGRIYGDWQNVPSSERLKFEIDGQNICQIDIKACYLNLANGLSGNFIKLARDPYSMIKFVKCPLTRDAAKVLVSALMFKSGDELTRFPKLTSKNGETSFKKYYGLEDKTKVGDLVADIYSAFPFIKDQKIDGLVLMYEESQIILSTILELVIQDIPTYPMHDCLICRTSDLKKVRKVLQKKIKAKIGYIPKLEVDQL